MDKISPETRSQVMRQVLSRGNRSTEWRLRSALIRSGIRGWKLSPRDVPGRPDFAFLSKRVLVFVDGCFWHGCARCDRMPTSNIAYWRTKIGRNRDRDKATTALLRRAGWRVIRLWEHQLKSTDLAVRRIYSYLN